MPGSDAATLAPVAGRTGLGSWQGALPGCGLVTQRWLG